MAEFIGNEYTYLFPGEVIVTGECLKISTVLGSCVSVCLYDEKNKISGMNHYLLPDNKENNVNQFRYGHDSLEYMLNETLKMGGMLIHLKACIYGGSSMFQDSLSFYNIGERNISLAKEFLRIKGISLKHSDTGGKLGRKIIFDTNTGIINNYYLTGQRKRL